MSFTVFLCYGIDRDEQALVWRKQTLAAAQGIQVFVPSDSPHRGPPLETRWSCKTKFEAQ